MEPVLPPAAVLRFLRRRRRVDLEALYRKFAPFRGGPLRLLEILVSLETAGLIRVVDGGGFPVSSLAGSVSELRMEDVPESDRIGVLHDQATTLSSDGSSLNHGLILELPLRLRGLASTFFEPTQLVAQIQHALDMSLQEVADLSSARDRAGWEVSRDVRHMIELSESVVFSSPGVSEDVRNSLRELWFSVVWDNPLSALVMAGRVLESCLRDRIRQTGVTPPADAGIGKLLGHGEAGKPYDAAFSNLAGVINAYRVSAAHAREHARIPTEHEILMVVHATLEVLSRFVRSQATSGVPPVDADSQRQPRLRPVAAGAVGAEGYPVPPEAANSMPLTPFAARGDSRAPPAGPAAPSGDD